MKTVLFLCTGNYYRSRYAEILFNSLAGKSGLGWQASSRGLALERGAGNVGPMDVSAVKRLKAKTIAADEAGARFPVPATPEDFHAAAWIVALKEEEHLPLLQERFPDWAEKVEFWQVDDGPFALPLIDQEVLDLADRLTRGGRPREVVAPDAFSEPASKFAAGPVKKSKALKVGRETAGRRGKGVTTIFDVPLDENGLKELAATIKQRCGTGGTVKDGRIEIQGDQRERIVAELEKLGYKVKRVGG